MGASSPIGVEVATDLSVTENTSLAPEFIPLVQTVGCVVYMACSVDAPGKIRHNSGNKLVLGYATTARSTGWTTSKIC
jgi:hypothetical protein